VREISRDLPLKDLVVYFDGFRTNTRQLILKALANHGHTVMQIIDKTQLAYNGCRLTKRPRR
jgi:ribosomal protein S11